MFLVPLLFLMVDYLLEHAMSFLFPSSRDVLGRKLAEHWAAVANGSNATNAAGVATAAAASKLSKQRSTKVVDSNSFSFPGIALGPVVSK